MKKKQVDKPITQRSLYAISEELSESVKAIFVECYRQRESALRGQCSWEPGIWWNGGRTRRGVVRPNIWRLGAKFIIKHELPVFQFIYYVVFDYNTRALPKPTLLISKTVAARYRHISHDGEQVLVQVQAEFGMQQEALEFAVSWYDDAEECGLEIGIDAAEIKRRVLMDTSTSLSALFRYCLAVNEEFGDIAKQYYDAALIQYVPLSRVYDCVWKDWIPDVFRMDADKLSRCFENTERTHHG